MTSCPALHPYAEDHDYSQPPHNTPDSPRDSNGECDPCQIAWDGCRDERCYEVVIYQSWTHDWVRVQACTPCTAAVRELLGPDGVASVSTATRPVEPLPEMAATRGTC